MGLFSLKQVTFKNTGPLPFNKFLFVIGDLSSKVVYSKSGTMVRSFIPRDFNDFLTAEIPAKCLSAAESYFEQSLSLEKIGKDPLKSRHSFFSRSH
jgi:hypothetical protein